MEIIRPANPETRTSETPQTCASTPRRFSQLWTIMLIFIVKWADEPSAGGGQRQRCVQDSDEVCIQYPQDAHLRMGP